MSLKVHCDWCEKFMYRTTSGQNEIFLPQYGENVIAGKLVFCDEQCRGNYVRRWYLGEDVDAPELVEIQ